MEERGLNIVQGKRVTSDERDRYETHIQACFEDRMMSAEEHAARMAAVQSVFTKAELDRLVSDLPAMPPPDISVLSAWRERRAAARAERAARPPAGWRMPILLRSASYFLVAALGLILVIAVPTTLHLWRDSVSPNSHLYTQLGIWQGIVIPIGVITGLAIIAAVIHTYAQNYHHNPDSHVWKGYKTKDWKRR